jgi:ribosome-associated translation inhibitor RaiA
MGTTLQITFHGLEHSDAAEALVREKLAELDGEAMAFTRCHVTIESPHRHHRKGNLFAVHLALQGAPSTIQTGELHRKSAHEDAFVAIRDVFDGARKQALQASHRMRGR